MFKRRGLRLVMLCVLLLIGWSLVQLQAQSPLVPLPTAESVASNNINSSSSASETPKNTTLAGFHIAYLIAEGAVAPDHVTSPQHFSDDFDAVVIYDWETFLTENINRPFEGIIIHKSALPFVDYDWVQAAYWRGIVISLIDIYYPEYPQLLGFQCGTPSDTFYKDNFWITYYISIKAIDPSDIEKVIETVKSCNKIDKISELSNMVNVAKGVGKESFDVENGYMIFTSSLTAKLLSATSVNQPVEIPLNEENK